MKDRTNSSQPALPGLEWEERSGPVAVQEAVKGAFWDIERIYEGRPERPARCLPLGFAELDRWIVGLKESELTVIGSLPGTGKTQFALHVAHHAAGGLSAPVLFFSPGSKGPKLLLRLLSVVGRTPANRIITGDIGAEDWPDMTTTAGRLCDLPLFFDDSPDPTVPEINRKAMRVREKAGLGLIIVDGLESVRLSRLIGGGETDHLERARSLKCIARSLDVPMIVTASLDRRSMGGADRRPALSDLLDRHIEIFADLVLLLHRETLAVHAGKEKTGRSLIDVHVAKNRSGPTGRVRLVLDHQYLRLEEEARTGSPA